MAFKVFGYGKVAWFVTNNANR